MNVHTRIKKVTVINPGSDSPNVEFAVEYQVKGEEHKHELTFTQMLSDFSGMDAPKVTDLAVGLVKDHVSTKLKAQVAIEEKKDKTLKKLVGIEFDLEL